MPSAAPDTLERADWMQASVSTLADHGPCCARARAWLIAMARSHDFASTDGLDVRGAALAHQALDLGSDALADRLVRGGQRRDHRLRRLRRVRARDLPRQGNRGLPRPGAAHLRRGEHRRTGATSGRRCRARSTGSARASSTTRSAWCASDGNQARVYDPTDGVWLDPEIYRGHGGHIAIRAELPVALKWGGTRSCTASGPRWRSRA